MRVLDSAAAAIQLPATVAVAATARVLRVATGPLAAVHGVVTGSAGRPRSDLWPGAPERHGSHEWRPARPDPAAVEHPPPLPDTAKVVDDEPVLTASFAEPAAADGAGPEIHADPPWDDYDGLKVPEIRNRIRAASPAELAAVRFYEATTKERRTVLQAVDAALGS